MTRRHGLHWSLAVWIGLGALPGCTQVRAPETDQSPQRMQLVEELRSKGIEDARVLDAIAHVPRERFVPAAVAHAAYDDRALAIGHGQTISQPYIVALMTELLAVAPTHRVLEIGTGSGYQAAVLSPLVERVYSIEIVEPLGRQAEATLAALDYDNIELRIGDGYAGWPEAAPFDRIIVTAAPEQVPQALVDQLAHGGRMVVPVGRVHAVQALTLIEKDAEGAVSRRRIAAVRFVPMTGGEGPEH